MSTTTFGPETQVGPNLQTPLPFDLAWSGFVEPGQMHPNELFHGVQSLTVPEQRLRSNEEGNVSVLTTQGGTEQMIELPVGMVVTLERYDPTDDSIQYGQPMYVGIDRRLSVFHPDDPADVVAFREAARIDSTEQVFFGDEAPVRVKQDPILPTIESWYPVNGVYEPTTIMPAPRSEHVLTADGQFELLRRLSTDDVVDVAGKTAVAEITEMDFATDLKAAEEETREIRITIPAPAPEPVSRWAALHEVVAERQEGLDLDGISMTHRAAMGLSGDNSNEERIPHRPAVLIHEPRRTAQNVAPAADATQEIVVPPRGLKARLAAGAAALTHMIPVGKGGRTGQRRATEGGEPAIGRHRANVTSHRATAGRHRHPAAA